jgi:hypothetical protein
MRIWFVRLVMVPVAALLIASGAAHASPLLTPSAELQLETWLGMGPLAFTNIFTRGPLDTTTTWHAAVDGQGPTVSLLAATDSSQNTYVLGGYDPRSWDTTTGYRITLADADRTGFIFNLNPTQLRTQKLSTDPVCPGCGPYQTYNGQFYGPTFGYGWDLYVDSSLTQGYEAPWSYGPGVSWQDTPGLLPLNSTRCGSNCGYDFFAVGALETYTFAPETAVPEPATLTLLASGMAFMVLARRRVKP